MRARVLGRSGLRVSEIALGSWLTLGSGSAAEAAERVDANASARLIRRAFDLGIFTFDTADVYQDGEAERALGRAVADLPRDRVVIATKCFFALSERPNDRGLSREHIFTSVEQSLQRLGTDYIDLHQCHRADPDTPLEETVQAYADLIRQGKLRHWGVSLWPSETIEAACEIADACGAFRPIAHQPEYSILERGIEFDGLARGARQGLGHLVFSPLAQGVLTGKYSGGRVPEGSRADDAKRNRWMSHALDRETLDRVDRLKPLADELGLSMAQLAIAWCLRRDEVSSVILGASRPEQLEENAKAIGHALPPSVLRAIDDLFPPPTSSALTSGTPFTPDSIEDDAEVASPDSSQPDPAHPDPAQPDSAHPDPGAPSPSEPR